METIYRASSQDSTGSDTRALYSLPVESCELPCMYVSYLLEPMNEWTTASSLSVVDGRFEIGESSLAYETYRILPISPG